MTSKVPPFSELIKNATTLAVHLEMRDQYTPDDPVFLRWLAGTPDPDPVYPDWYDLVRTLTARGVSVRRARVVSEPLSEFVRFEYDITDGLNIAAGERVRWLPRRQASDLCLPGNDFWVLDDRLVRFGYFAGNGDYLGEEMSDDPALVHLCTSAFEAVWERSTDHAEYQPK
ncbi:MAG: DUF6879 family protein [Streptosporangiaceae bacterium]